MPVGPSYRDFSRPEPGRRLLVIRRAGHLGGPGVRRVRQQRAETDDKPHVERPHDIEQFFAEGPPSHVGLDTSYEDEIEFCARGPAQ